MADVDRDEEPEPSLDERIGGAVAEALADDRIVRSWADRCIRALEVYSREPERAELVQQALDDMALAASRRLTRLFQSDLALGNPDRVE